MWVSSIFPSNLIRIGPLTMEIYYQIGITGIENTDTHAHRLNMILSPYTIEGRVKSFTKSIKLYVPQEILFKKMI